jgi:hypothetical protein
MALPKPSTATQNAALVHETEVRPRSVSGSAAVDHAPWPEYLKMLPSPSTAIQKLPLVHDMELKAASSSTPGSVVQAEPL